MLIIKHSNYYSFINLHGDIKMYVILIILYSNTILLMGTTFKLNVLKKLMTC